MKLTKKELKGILKECLKEIFKEDPDILLTSAISQALAEQKQLSPRKQSKKEQQVNEVLTNSVDVPVEIENPFLKEKVDILTESIVVGSNKDKALYKSIFQDTAINTLQRQNEGVNADPSIGLPASPQEIIQDKAQLKTLSSDGDIKHWAAVAFRKKNGN